MESELKVGTVESSGGPAQIETNKIVVSGAASERLPECSLRHRVPGITVECR
ncbi:hypothetical protein [Kribbella sp. NPDC051137]|uniref:hypothetical protein n=1 Tax=Kribbella sp. NPDC051137 TaxID=3155045 RepID=UPI003446E500